MIKRLITRLITWFNPESKSVFVINLDDKSKEEIILSCDSDEESKTRNFIISNLSNKSYKVTNAYISASFDEYEISDESNTHSGRILIYHQSRRRTYEK